MNTGQDSVESREITLKKVHTDLNVADLMTKYLTPNKRDYLMGKMNMYYFDDQHPLALRA